MSVVYFQQVLQVSIISDYTFDEWAADLLVFLFWM